MIFFNDCIRVLKLISVERVLNILTFDYPNQ
jgi:hypothetical protein